MIQSGAGLPLRQETERLWPEISHVAARARLPLVDLALPGLRQLSAAQYEQFLHVVRQLIESDSEINLFEYVLQKVTLRHLEPQFKPVRKPVIQYYAFQALAPDCAVLLSALAHVGTSDLTQARAAFEAAISRFGSFATVPLEFIPADRCDLPQVDAALNRINQASPQIKKHILEAAALTVAADGLIAEMEAELLRGIADSLDCPIPPFIPTGNPVGNVEG
jgi:hypothetical protein